MVLADKVVKVGLFSNIFKAEISKDSLYMTFLNTVK